MKCGAFTSGHKAQGFKPPPAKSCRGEKASSSLMTGKALPNRAKATPDLGFNQKKGLKASRVAISGPYQNK